MSDWGLLPGHALALLRQRAWDNRRHFRQLLVGRRPFPIRLPLKPPTPAQALADMSHLRQWVAEWRRWPRPEQVRWEHREFRHAGAWRLPMALHIESMQALLECLGGDALRLSGHWERVMAPILAFDPSLFPPLTRHLGALEQMNEDDARLIAALLPQLRRGSGQGQYLRGLTLTGVDTKFVETWQSLIAALLDSRHQGEITDAGGLLAWLDCREAPKSWLMVRPLCPRSRERLGGLPLLQLDGDTLAGQPLPAGNILIIENRQATTGTGLGLPALDDCIAIFGGGRNLSWMSAPWLANKSIGYWGDIDSWGLTILSEARGRQPHLQSLMMDLETLQRFARFQVAEPSPNPDRPAVLSPEEQELWKHLRSEGNIRLEQERLPQDYVHSQLRAWLS